MSFLSNNNSEFLSARITKKGRNSIAKGDFNISYFQVGDSEFDYNNPFTGLTGLVGVPHQKVMMPFDRDNGVKYPYKMDTSTSGTTYGVPVENSSTTTIRNVMGPAGFISEFEEYNASDCTGTTIKSSTDEISILQISGSTSITVSNGTEFQNCEYITLVFDRFCGLDANSAVVSGQTNSLIYKIVSISGNTLNLDRSTPNLSSIGGYVQVVCNSCENEYPLESEVSPVCLPNSIDPSQQLNPWTLNVVWEQKPIGADVNGLDESLTGYTSNVFVSAKEFFGYTSTGQTITNLTGGTISKPTSFINSFNEKIEVLPSEQRCVAIIHYSELGDLRNDPERFYKYDDYISNKTSTGDSLVDDRDGAPISDTEYFEVYLPFIYYHRSTGTTLGAIFTMDTTDYYVSSTINASHQTLFRYLIDETGVKVGKVFVNNQVIVFDDQELVAMLDYRANRRYTLPSPKLSTVHSDLDPSNSLLSGTTGQTVWITYMFQYTGDTELNGFPCNYFNKIQLGDTGDVCLPVIPSNVTMKFSGNTFSNMYTSLSGVVDGFIANKFYALVQRVNTGSLPVPNMWKIIDLTSSISGHTVGNLIDPSKLRNYTFTITNTSYSAASFFDLETYLKNTPSDTDYLGYSGSTTQPQFGDQQPFPGSIRLVRATDVQQMNFLVNLPASQFNTTQNPTYVTGMDKRITEVALLNSNKEPLVIAKTSVPVKRSGTQVFGVKLDL